MPSHSFTDDFQKFGQDEAHADLTVLTDAELDQVSGGVHQQSGNNGAIKFNLDDDRAPEVIFTPGDNVIVPGLGRGCG